ncbi:bifunctional 3'-5' exonuclease/DNA polymerase [Brevibacterium sp. 5221]|uniref:DNA-directed DNA polymerase n=1 Tax=Brevibacterium rongguiense TaxID=2695267 RepID=A0A6N9H9D0_9MICO|nr:MULTISPECIES: bifunctional 3'-5' exonuclease/DNA polymerase [Brevibacterium]MYM20700.1 bifunctional 3'-5' exonuclease/DNA polymerase [Brevibacterium rongguiense]WAL39530.1 bifunctional 3'-5' exonuclease/DNA polymerase [Brevibacterium sp. BRM-1]
MSSEAEAGASVWLLGTRPEDTASGLPAPHSARGVVAVELDGAGEPSARREFDASELPGFVRARAGRPTRFAFSDTPLWYPPLLAAGVTIERSRDLRLAHAILAGAQALAGAPEGRALAAAQEWAAPPLTEVEDLRGEALFDVEEFGSERRRARTKQVPHDIDSALAEYRRQERAIAASAQPARLRLLLAAESAGGLVAAEMQAAGVPWDVAEHDRILAEHLGPRPMEGAKPAKMLEVAQEVRAALGDPRANLDSPPRLLQALRNAGINVASTSKWELREHDHSAVEPLLRYKKQARLLAANGWNWLDEWVRDGRYRPVYVPGGVVTGRWAASGGGALQIPRQLRPALRADPGWTLISADVAQLEPRALTAMSGDRAMAEAGRGRDLYSGLVEEGIVGTRQEAKIAVLGAMYGSTTGESGRLVPRLRTSFPAAMALVDSAAEVGRRGGRVSTWLGRTSPEPDERWREAQARGNRFDASPQDENRARRAAGDWGRFTRNFVVQGTAAEWALAWLADLRLRLAQLPATGGEPARASGPVFERRAHLVFFLHDEVIVHAPLEQAEVAAQAIREAAASAGRVMFGQAPVDFPLDLTVAERAAKG